MLKDQFTLVRRSRRAARGVLALILLLASTRAQGQVWTQDAKLGATGSSLFGASVSLDNDLVLVGSPRDDHGGVSQAGAAHLFDCSSGTWKKIALLTAGDPTSLSEFGASVSLSGDAALIGAEELHITGTGSAYIFERSGNTWSQKAKLTASDGAPDERFGYAVSLDGNLALVGAWLHHTDPKSRGAAYIFERIGNTWMEVAKLTPSDAASGGGHFFGTSVSLSGDRAMIGAPGDPPNSAGAVYIFERSGGIWSQVEKLTAYDRQEADLFGCSVSLDGNRALIGADWDGHNGLDLPGSAYVYERNQLGNWYFAFKMTAPIPEKDEQFGHFVSLDGNLAAIGTSKDAQRTVYIFEYGNAGLDWLPIAELHGDSGSDYEFGISVSVKGRRVAAGARSSNSAYIFSANYFVRGDANSDGVIDLTDGIVNLNFQFLGASPPACMDAADTDDNGQLELTDAIRLFNWLYSAGPAPGQPTPSSPIYPMGDCGLDPTPQGDTMGCIYPSPVCQP